MAIDLDTITELEDSTLFKFDKQPPRPTEWDPSDVFQLSIENNLDI